MAIWHDPLADTYEKPLTEYAAGLGEYLGAVADEAWANNPVPSLWRMGERRRAEKGEPLAMGMPEMGDEPLYSGPRSPLISKAEANERGKDLGLKFDKDTPEELVELLIKRRREQLAADLVYKRARLEGYGIGRASLSVLADFAIGAVDPLNVASAFIPIVGPARFASWTARLGAGRAALVRGAIEGTVGAALVEPIVAANAAEEDPDWRLASSFANIAFGGALGAGLHFLGSRLRRSPERGELRAPPEAAPRDQAPSGEARSASPEAREASDADVPQRTAEAVDAMPREQRETVQRVGLAQLLQDKRIDVAPLAPDVERQLLGEAYDRVRASPQGRFDDPLVVLKPGEIEDVVVSRGGWQGVGDATVKGRGFGLAKIIWRHGDESAKPPEFRVTREDVLALPEILRLYEPSQIWQNAAGAVGKREWRVDREWQGQTRTVVYAVSRFDDPKAAGGDGSARLVTIYVEEAPSSIALSERKSAPSGSSGPVVSGAGDTAAPTSDRAAQSRGGAPEENIAPTAAPDNAARAAELDAWAKRQQEPESDLHADFPAAERVAAAAEAAKAAKTPEQDLAELEATWGRALGDEDRAAMKGDVAGVRDPELVETARAVKALDDEAKAIDALAVCQAGGKPAGGE